MSLHFILDGYNIIKRDPQFSEKAIKDARDALIRIIRIGRPQGSLKNTITIIFDGKPHIFGSSPSADFEVLFTKDCSADDEIKKKVKAAANPKEIVVVSDDRDIQLFIRSYGAKIMQVEEFLNKPKKDKKNFNSSSNLGLTAQQALRITEELKDIWLSK